LRRGVGFAPTSLSREVSLRCAIPEFQSDGNQRYTFFYLSYSFLRSRRLSKPQPSWFITKTLYGVEVTRTFTTPESFAAGIGGPSAFTNALPFEPQQLSLLAGFEPATVVRCNACLHNAENF
jgi:hypothetical protein